MQIRNKAKEAGRSNNHQLVTRGGLDIRLSLLQLLVVGCIMQGTCWLGNGAVELLIVNYYLNTYKMINYSSPANSNI